MIQIIWFLIKSLPTIIWVLQKIFALFFVDKQEARSCVGELCSAVKNKDLSSLGAKLRAR